MARHSAILLAAALAMASMFALASGAAFPSTTGVRYAGYTMLSEVVGYTNMTQDVCDIEAAVAAGNNTAALDIYLYGKNSVSGSSLRKFMTWATAVHPNETYFDLLAAYYGQNFTATLNETIKSAFTSGQGTLGASLIIITTQVKYMMHEIDAAYSRVLINNTNVTSGPAHNLDEAWTIFAGAHPDNCTTLLSIASKYGADLGATHSGVASTIWATIALMNELQYFSITGNSTAADYKATAADLRQEVATVLAQAVLGASYESELNRRCNTSTAGMLQKHVAWAAWWPLAAQLSGLGASTSDLQAVNAALQATTLSYSAVKAALLKSAVLGPIAVKDVGLPIPARVQPSGCSATVAP